MERKNVRIPKQKRSIEKKEKIIEAAEYVFNRKGFFGATTDDIAAEAGFSVGSVYSYFTDKKDILLACCNRFGQSLTDDICDEIRHLSDTGDIQDTIRRALEILQKSHTTQSHLYHDEVMSLKFRDEDLRDYFIHIQKSLMEAVVRTAEAKGYCFTHPEEQTFLLFQLLEGIEDELAFHENPKIDHDILIEQCVRLITSMLTKKESH
jgi:AcrR family transcriptional regulator